MKRVFVIVIMFFLSVSALGQGRDVVRCRIWKTKTFCLLPNSVTVPETAKYTVGTSVVRIACAELDKQNLVGVWVTVRETSVGMLRLKDGFSNIYVIRKDSSEKQFPVAYVSRPYPAGKPEGNPQFLSNQSKFGGECVYELKSSGRYDLFFLFEAAEMGDTLIIEGFLEAEIK